MTRKKNLNQIEGCHPIQFKTTEIKMEIFIAYPLTLSLTGLQCRSMEWIPITIRIILLMFCTHISIRSGKYIRNTNESKIENGHKTSVIPNLF